jgi:hypothetical protein
MKRIAAAILLLWTTAAPAEILCRDKAGNESGAYWSWREIDGRRCWFKRHGAMPPKSELRWAKQETGREMKEESPSAPPEQRPPSIQMLKTQPLREGMSESAANWIDGDAPVNLMLGEELSGPAGVGGSWVVPAYNKNATDETPFAGRFAPVIKFGRQEPR